ncbi:MAG: hypothetical protein LBM04_10680 [Opitutaceae bacterium]|jgi:hypothetical protein|nr:hypothetical protein [Opitutaceae bacterium]
MSAPAPKDPALADHLAWLGYVQPEGLVVSAQGLKESQAIIDRASLAGLQNRFLPFVSNLPTPTSRDADATTPGIGDPFRFLTEFLEWPLDHVTGWDVAHPLPETLTVSLPEYHETLSPNLAVSRLQPKPGESPWLLLVQTLSIGTDFDKPSAALEHNNWKASPAKKFERLLRETQIPIGLLANGVAFRLVYAPPKENSGSITFRVDQMSELPGRLILGAFHLLLNGWTLFNAPGEARLPALLQRSRDCQASVSEKLAGQVLHALYELLRGFEAADAIRKGALLGELAARHPQDIYGGLVTVLLRMVFVLFAEDRGLLPIGGLYVRNYSMHGLFERLRADNERHPDTMDQRYGAWAQLLALFRIIHGGCDHPELRMPAREGHLFEPDRHPFLEGRASRHAPLEALPYVSDGVLHRILEKLCILEGERVSYRTLDVEEIGSVYQTIMGFGVEVVTGTAIALKGKRKKGAVPAAPVIDLEALLAEKPGDRLKMLAGQADTKLTGEAEREVREASTVDHLLAALDKRIDRNSTPSPVGKGGLVLQPNDERRRSGSHYTPRSFTEPIVRKTLEPVLARLVSPELATVPADRSPTPAQILDLKVADIAVGSAAFLVEACRQLGDALVRAWDKHGGRPPLPPDETEELLAMRAIAQRCLYGVDRNPMAVDLAKLSLWLATLAKDHPFTFLDHNIRCGDSLVGLTQKQIEAFTWEEKTADKQSVFGQDFLIKRIKAATTYRREILEGGDYMNPGTKAEKLRGADDALDEVRFAGDLIISAFFSADKDKARKQKLEALRERYVACHTSKTFDPNLKPREEVEKLRSGDKAVWPFHWEIEFPEVFGRENGGFDIIIGNPPYLGSVGLARSNAENYTEFLRCFYPRTAGKVDLAAFFIRRAFVVQRQDGVLGFITTQTICQGDTRSSGLAYILKNSGVIYCAHKRYKWPGAASVIVSVVHIAKTSKFHKCELDGKFIPRISAFLLNGHQDEIKILMRCSPFAGLGNKPNGKYFCFSNSDSHLPLTLKDDLLATVKGADRIIVPYIGGNELNSMIEDYDERWIADFTDIPLLNINDYKNILDAMKTLLPSSHRDDWWKFDHTAVDLRRNIRSSKVNEILCIAESSDTLSFRFLPVKYCISNAVVGFSSEDIGHFALLQSQSHQIWVRSVSSSLKDDPRYVPDVCYFSFPFPENWESNNSLKIVGKIYYDFRAALMVRNNEGLTKTYNHFHDPAETSPDILKLRELHAEMDRAVLDAYGWTDIPTDCEFLLDYEDEDDGEAEGKARKRKKPWRFRWPDAVRDEVLARLLKLNAERAEQERLTGLAASTSKPTTGAKRGKKLKIAKPVSAEPSLFVNAYPIDTADELICSLALELLEWHAPMPRIEHMTALLLFVKQDVSKKLFPELYTKQTEKLLGSVSNEIEILLQRGITYNECLNYLDQHMQAIAVNANPSELRMGLNYQMRKNDFTRHAGLGAFAFTLLQKYEELKARLIKTPQEESAVLTVENELTKHAAK